MSRLFSFMLSKVDNELYFGIHINNIFQHAIGNHAVCDIAYCSEEQKLKFPKINLS